MVVKNHAIWGSDLASVLAHAFSGMPGLTSINQNVSIFKMGFIDRPHRVSAKVKRMSIHYLINTSLNHHYYLKSSKKHVLATFNQLISSVFLSSAGR